MRERILIIDDEALILSSLERALGRVGYEIFAVMDIKGFQAALTSAQFDLIIMDLHIKDVKTDDLVKEAKKAMPSVKFMTISGSAPPPDSRYFLQKPFRIDDLRERVREILDEPSRD